MTSFPADFLLQNSCNQSSYYFSALSPLGGRQERHPAGKESRTSSFQRFYSGKQRNPTYAAVPGLQKWGPSETNVGAPGPYFFSRSISVD